MIKYSSMGLREYVYLILRLVLAIKSVDVFDT